MTTGATLNELAKVLRKCGASAVSAWAVARTFHQIAFQPIPEPNMTFDVILYQPKFLPIPAILFGFALIQVRSCIS